MLFRSSQCRAALLPAVTPAPRAVWPRSGADRSARLHRSPTHAGGLFAIERSYFLELGGYDPGLLAWGAENFELSFKVGPGSRTVSVRKVVS